MNTILIAVILITLMSGMACAELEYDWEHGRRNVAPENISHVYYDFEEGSNCAPFNNQYPEVATFLTVLGTHPYGADTPSYVQIGGRSCGATRCEMFIYPHPNLYPNGTPRPWIYVLNERCAFAPITGPDTMGGYWPGMKARIQFKEDTHYISFLASTGGNLGVRLYDAKGSQYNPVYYETIPTNTDRVGTGPSESTRFYVHLPNMDIIRMDLSGSFNAWHIDDLIIGGEPGYVYERRDYSYAAERLKHLVGAQYLEYGAGYNILTREFYTPEQIIDSELPYFNPEIREVQTGEGIYDENAIVYAFNELEDIVNWLNINRMASRDFTEEIAHEDIQAGDVVFIDYPPADGCYDEVGMIIDPQYNQETGMYEDVIRIIPEEGVHYSSTNYINSLYDTTYGFVDYRSLPDNPKGGHTPYPKIPSKFFI